METWNEDNTGVGWNAAGKHVRRKSMEWVEHERDTGPQFKNALANLRSNGHIVTTGSTANTVDGVVACAPPLHVLPLLCPPYRFNHDCTCTQLDVAGGRRPRTASR